MTRGITKALAALLMFGAGLAHSFTLSGTVFGGSSPLPSATVTLFDANTSAQLQQTTTNGSGQYTFTVNEGTYNIQVAPQAPSLYGLATVNGIAVSAGNVVQDVVLLPVNVAVSGTIRGYGGAPLVGASVFAYTGPGFATLSASTQTNALGQYSVDVPAGTPIGLVLSHSRAQGTDPTMPTTFQADGRYGGFIASANLTKDYDLPLYLLSGRSTDGNSVPVPGVNVTTGGTVYVSSWTYPGTSESYDLRVGIGPGDTVSSGTGQFQVKLPPGTTTLFFQPPAGSGLGTTSTPQSMTGDVSRDFVLPSLHSVSGTIRGYGGAPLVGTSVFAYTGPGFATLSASTQTNALGQYSVDVPAGTPIGLVLSHSRAQGTDPTMPTTFQADGRYGGFIASANLTKDYDLPLYLLSGRSTDGNSVPVPGVNVTTGGTVYVSSWTYPGTSESYDLRVGIGPGDTVSSGTGQFQVKLPPGTTTLFFQPPAGSGLGTTSTPQSMTGDVSRDFVLPSLHSVSGTIRGYGGAPLVGTSVFAYTGPGFATLSASTQTNALGQYSVDVPAGTPIGLVLSHSRAQGTDPTMPTTFQADGRYGGFIASANLTKDYDLPLYLLSGRSTDGNSVPVPGVNVTTGGTVYVSSWTYPGTSESYDLRVGIGPGDTVSSGTGQFQVKLPPGTTTLFFQPPAGSGFGAISVPMLMDSSKALSVILPLPDTVGPLILSGPFVRELTSSRAQVEWLTNEPTSGSVTIVGGATFTEPGAARTNHSVLVTGLTASTNYTAQVSSTDTSGNGPVTASAPFTTKPAPDTTPPVFIDGPSVTAVTHQDAVVEWKTDEAAAGIVDYGTTVAFGSSASDSSTKVRQRIGLTGLTPSTVYQVRASATDATGNGPTQSATLSFKTLAAPDVDPPKIVGKPVALEVTSNAATIAWVTDKPSTSGVSWNDGTAYGLVTDTAFVTKHTVRISGLGANKGYTVTASSKDEKDNGPTLSAISFSTLPAGDVLPPAITGAPTVLNAKMKTATISWKTSEPADGKVLYGTSAVALTEQESQAKLDTRHQVTLTNLTPNTTYHYRVESRDVAGNVSAPTPVLSFATPSTNTAAFVFEQAPLLLNKTDKTITVEWATSAPGDAQLECDPVGGGETKRVARAERDTKQQLTISNLQPNVAYNCRAKSIDLDGNGVEQ